MNNFRVFNPGLSQNDDFSYHQFLIKFIDPIPYDNSTDFWRILFLFSII